MFSEALLNSIGPDSTGSWPAWFKIALGITALVVAVFLVIPLIMALWSAAQIAAGGTQVVTDALSWLDKNLPWILGLVTAIGTLGATVKLGAYMREKGYFSKNLFGTDVPNRAAVEKAYKAGVEAQAKHFQKAKVDQENASKEIKDAAEEAARTAINNSIDESMKSKPGGEKEEARNAASSRLFRKAPETLNANLSAWLDQWPRWSGPERQRVFLSKT